jgi:hypothetical protein
MLGQMYLVIDGWIRRQIIKFRIYTLGFPRQLTGTSLYNFSATQPIEEYLGSKQPGVTVFWAPAYSGKSFTLNRLADPVSSNDHVFIYVDFKSFRAKEDNVVHFLHGRLGLNDHRCALSAFLPSDAAFITVVLDHFEVAVDGSPTDALNLIRELSADSTTAKVYNVLVLTKKADQAQMLLRSSLGRLLGPRVCGRWIDWPGGEFSTRVSLGCESVLMAF